MLGGRGLLDNVESQGVVVGFGGRDGSVETMEDLEELAALRVV